jgi:hypothetical protein
MRIYITILSIFILTMACNNSDTPPPKPKKEPIPELSSISVTLPEAPGSDEFKSNCMTCHSLKYIEMQPNFTRKTWQKEVDKMIKTFGAPITDSAAVKIVDYLAAIKGKE